MEQARTEEMQNTPDLDRTMEEGRPVFSGAAEPPADEPGPVVIGGPGQEPAAPPIPPAAATPVAPPTPKPAVAPQEPAGKGPDAPRGDYRFKTLEDADKSYRLLQSEKTKTDLRIKALERERDAAKTAEAKAAEVEAEDQQFVEFATERNKKALEEINALEPDDPDYTAKAAGCWTRANLAIRRWNPQAKEGAEAFPPDGTTATKPPGNPPGEERASERLADATFTTKEFIEGVLENAALGIPKDDPLFWTFAEQSPSANEDGTPKEMKDQIWWAVEKTLNYRRNVANVAAPAAPENLPDPQGNGSQHPAIRENPPPAVPMGRSGAFRPSGGGETVRGPVSLAETLDSVMEMRRL